MKIEGFNTVMPIIKSVGFAERSRLVVSFADGRVMSVSLAKFPSIKKLSEKERKQVQIIGGEGFTFKASDEVFHIEQILGDYETYRYGG